MSVPVPIADGDEDGDVSVSLALTDVSDLSLCSCPLISSPSTLFSALAALKRARRSLSRLLASHRVTSNGEKKLGDPELESPKPKSHQHLSMRRTMPSIGGTDDETIVDDEMEDVIEEEGGEVREA